MLKKSALLFVFIALIACNNELEINAPYEDVTVVYGMLNAGKDTNWVRIHRAYLGNEGITGGNQEPDSIYYRNLEVMMEELDDNNNIINTYTLPRDNESRQLDSGFFTTDEYRLYRFVEPVDVDRIYRVVIDKPDGEGDRVTAETPVVGSFDVTSPRGLLPVSFGRNGEEFAWSQASNGRIYQGFLRFHYIEFPRDDVSDSVERYVDYNLPVKLGDAINGGQDISVNLSYQLYYSFLFNAIGVDENITRFYRGMDIYIAAGADDLNTYINVSQPAQGIVQDKPFYTNVTNGAGIFSSRANAEKLRMPLSSSSLDSLVKGIYTCDLRFAKATAGDTCFCDPTTLSGFRCE
jgi:hypothetical protein